MEALFVNLIQTQDQMLDMVAKGGLCTGAWQSFRGAKPLGRPRLQPQEPIHSGRTGQPSAFDK